MAILNPPTNTGFTASSPSTLTRTPTSVMPKQATLINPAGNKVVVDASPGNAQAQSYFAQGYQLMGPDGRPVGSPAPVSSGTSTGTSTGTTGATGTGTTGTDTNNVSSQYGLGPDSFLGKVMDLMGQSQVANAKGTATQNALKSSELNLGLLNPPLQVTPGTALNYENAQSALYNPQITNISDQQQTLANALGAAQNIGQFEMQYSPETLQGLAEAYKGGATLSTEQMQTLASAGFFSDPSLETSHQNALIQKSQLSRAPQRVGTQTIDNGDGTTSTYIKYSTPTGFMYAPEGVDVSGMGGTSGGTPPTGAGAGTGTPPPVSGKPSVVPKPKASTAFTLPSGNSYTIDSGTSQNATPAWVDQYRKGLPMTDKEINIHERTSGYQLTPDDNAARNTAINLQNKELQSQGTQEGKQAASPFGQFWNWITSH
ncbi:MAG: hypothetical protein KGL39_33965 [Patescibacteria group bacterium]|nr:hypothetical protein [Patescibacteria group bacterium]